MYYSKKQVFFSAHALESACSQSICWSAVGEESALHRLSQGTSVAHTDVGKQGTLDDAGADVLAREDALARSKSKKGRFNVTPAGANTVPLHRTSLSTCTPPPCVLCMFWCIVYTCANAVQSCPMPARRDL